MRYEFFQRLAQLTFKKAVELQGATSTKNLSNFVRTTIWPLKKRKKFNNEDVEDLKQSKYTHLCIVESAMNRESGESGDSLWKTAISDQEELKMGLDWNRLLQPYYFHVMSCLESEVVYCSLTARKDLYGRVYGSFFISQKSRVENIQRWLWI